MKKVGDEGAHVECFWDKDAGTSAIDRVRVGRDVEGEQSAIRCERHAVPADALALLPCCRLTARQFWSSHWVWEK